MRLTRTFLLAVALVAVPWLARAQDSAPPAGPLATVATPVDPARLAAARQTVDYIFPLGTYGRIMGKTMDTMMGPMMDGVGAMPLSSLAGMGGMTSADTAKLGKTTLADMMTILDPAYRKRMEISTHVMTTEMAKVMSEIEPGMRDALSHAYARRFDLSQLGELNRFFGTPTGRIYASESMTIMADPDIIAQMQGFVPTLLKRMPEVMTKVQQATASLPKPRKYEDLTPAEKARLRCAGDQGCERHRLVGEAAVVHEKGPGSREPGPFAFPRPLIRRR